MSNTTRQSTATTTHHADAQWRLREADGEADAFYLARQQHHWFGAQYDSQATLPIDYFPIADWELGDDADPEAVEKMPIDTHGVIAEHVRGDHAVRVGGGVVLLLDDTQTVDELPPGKYDRDQLVGETNAWFMLGVVDPAWRGRGIGTALLDARLEWATSTDAEMAFACGWERDRKETSRGLLDDAGFVPVQRIEEMYVDTGRTSCPDCGIWPSDERACRCDATVWAKDL